MNSKTFFIIVALIFLNFSLALSQEVEIFIVKSLENGLQYLEKVSQNFNLQEADRFRIKVFVEPVQKSSRVLLDHRTLCFELGELECYGKLVCQKNKNILNLLVQGKGEVVWKYKFHDPIDIWDFPYVRINFKNIDSKPNIKVSFYFDVNDDRKEDLILGGVYPRQFQLLKTFLENVSSKKFEEKNYSYLIKRELGIDPGDAWRYIQDGQFTVIQKVFKIPTSKAHIIKFYLSPIVRSGRVNISIDTDGNGRKDRLIVWEQLVRHQKKEKDYFVIELDLEKTLNNLKIDVKKARIYEIVLFVRGSVEQNILHRKVFKKIEFYQKEIGKNNDSFAIPLESYFSDNRMQLVFDLQKGLKQKEIFSAKLVKIYLNLSFKKDFKDFFSVESIDIVNFCDLNVPLFLWKPYKALRKFIKISLFPGEYVKNFDLLWWENRSIIPLNNCYTKDRIQLKYLQINPQNCFLKPIKENKFLSIEGYFLPYDPSFLNMFCEFIFDLSFKDMNKILMKDISYSGPIKIWVKLIWSDGEEKVYPIENFIKDNNLFIDYKQSENLKQLRIIITPIETNILWKFSISSFEDIGRINILPKLFHELDCLNSSCKQKLIEKKFNKELLDIPFLKVRYKGSRELYARIYYTSKNKILFVKDIYLPSNNGIVLPFLMGKILKKIEIWSYPNSESGNLQNILASRDYIQIDEIIFGLFSLEELQLSNDPNNIHWFDYKHILDFSPVIGKSYFIKSSFQKKILLPSEFLESRYPYAFKLKYHFSEKVIGTIFIRIPGNQTNEYPFLLREKGEIYFPLWLFFDSFPQQILLDFQIKTLYDKPIILFFDEFELISYGFPNNISFLASKELLRLLEIDKEEILFENKNLNDEIYFSGGWLMSKEEIELTKGFHNIKVLSKSHFVVKAVVLEAQKKYPIPQKEIIAKASRDKIRELVFLFFKFFSICFVIYFLFHSGKFRKFLKKIKNIWLKFYAFFPDVLWFFLWLVIAVVFYEKGFGQKFSKGENLWWTFADLFLVISYHHFIKAIKNIFCRIFPKIGQLVYKSSGTPYISGFIFILSICAIFLFSNLEPAANRLAIIGYYLLLIGVICELLDIIRERS